MQNLQKLSSFISKETSFNFIKALLKEFPTAEIFLVGGAVRDFALGNQDVNDYDFVVRNVSAKKLSSFLKKHGLVNLVGRHFGVFKFVPTPVARGRRGQKLSWEAFDIALPRTEHSLGTSGGYKDFEIQSNPKLPIELDLSRRDFTINALAWDLGKNELVDLFDGLKDLKKKIIRTVGQPKIRFAEDYSRMLRAVRFACQLDFEIDKPTWQFIKKNINLINKTKNNDRVVPYETIAKELLKAFYFNPVKALDLFDASNIIKETMPELLKMKKCIQPKNWHTEGDVWRHTRLCLSLMNSAKFKKRFGAEKPGAQLIMGVLAHDLGKPYTIQTPKKDKVDRIRYYNHDTVGAELFSKICKRLKLSSPPHYGIDCDQTAWLIKNHLVDVQIKEMKNTTVEKYFLNPGVPGNDLIKLLYLDAQGTIPPSGRPDMGTFNILMKRIKEIKKLPRKKTQKITPPILNGHEIIKKFKLKPGPRIGELLDALREQQLTGKIKTKIQAAQFLKNYL
ncbi:MAG TPA: HD domain-containing protein, partial [Patescibacteria group bacterium]